ncbi:MAG: hypothetical protein RLP02_34480 [Coleofasciculus sp. C2-GNP5-27]
MGVTGSSPVVSIELLMVSSIVYLGKRKTRSQSSLIPTRDRTF